MPDQSKVRHAANIPKTLSALPDRARTPIGAELKLLIAALRWPVDLAVVEEMRTCSGAVDWTELLALTARHRVDALVLNALTVAQISLPQTEQLALAERARRSAVHELIAAGETSRLVARLDIAQIDVRVLKGVTVALMAFGRLGLRFSSDIDLLVREEQVDLALTCLLSRGYCPREKGFVPTRRYVSRFKDVELYNESTGLTVELHWRLFDNKWLMPQPFELPAQMVAFAGRSMPALPSEYAFRYLCLHGAHHAWSRLKWIADINALLSHISDIGTLYLNSRGMGERRAVGQALLLCHQWFGTPLPELVIADYEKQRRLRRLVSAATAAAVGTGANELETTHAWTTGKNISHYQLSYDPRFLANEFWFDINDNRRSGTFSRFGLFGRVKTWLVRRFMNVR